MYYLKGSTMIGQLVAIEGADDDSTRLSHMRLRHTSEYLCKHWRSKDCLKMENLQLEFCEHCIIGKKMKV